MHKLRLAFFGTPSFSLPTLSALIDAEGFEVAVIVTQPDRPAGRGKKLTPSPVKELASSLNIPLLQPSSIRKELPDFLAQLATFGPFDGAVVIAFGQILPRGLLEFFRRNCVNVHASLLPEYRGAAPVQRVLLAGAATTGISLMKMEEGLDTGPVFVKEEISIPETWRYGELHDALAKLGATLLVQHLRTILKGELAAAPQDDAKATYAQKIEKHEGVIDWHESAQKIVNQIRGLWPTPSAYTFLRGKRIKIARASVTDSKERKSTTVPGTLLVDDQKRLLVCCGNRCVALEEVQPEGKGCMPIQDFLRGHQIESGLQLGSNDDLPDTMLNLD